MVYVLIFIGILILIALVYFFLPFFKNKNLNIFKKIADRNAKRKQEKEDKKNSKKLDVNIEKNEKKEDTDTKVEENNLEYNGFFETNFAPEEEALKVEPINEGFDDIFDSLFSDSKPTHSSLKYSENDLIKDGEISDFLTTNNEKSEDISQIISDLPPEIKAMLFSNVLDKKDDI